MTILEMITKHTASFWLTVVVVVFSLIQISPLELNPWKSIGSWIGRMCNGDVLDKLDSTKKEILETIELNEVEAARYRILRFDDEIRLGVRHSKEHFDQILADTDVYEKYCTDHPFYPNNKAVCAIHNIKTIYEACRINNDFL